MPFSFAFFALLRASRDIHAAFIQELSEVRSNRPQPQRQAISYFS
jgi:hypothetical protein